MRTALDALYRIAGILAGLFLICIGVFTFLAIISRMFKLEIYSLDEFAGWSMAASMFLGLAATLRTNEHIRVSLLIERLAPKTRHVFEVLCLLISTVFFAVFSWYAIEGVMESHLFGEMTQGVVPVPLWIPQSGMAIGVVIMLIALSDDLLCALMGKPTSYERCASTSLTDSI